MQILLLTLWFAYLVPLTDCKISGAFILPHGGISLNPSQFETTSKLAKEWAWKIHRAAVEVGRHVQDLRPDLIFLSTPHGIADMQRFVFYLSGRGNGSAETDNCRCPPCCYDNLDVKMDSDFASKLTHELTVAGMNVSGLTFFGPLGDVTEAAPLKWGEAIPLLFIKEMKHSKVVVLSQPARRYDANAATMVPELLTMGAHLFDKLEAYPGNVAVVISADLAHTHQANGPYGYSPAAEPFDKAIGNWAATLHPTYLLDIAPQYVDQAKSCGFTGFVMLHGLLEAGKLSSWIPVLHANYHPSYYGMMIASFQRQDHCPNCTK